MINYPYPRAFLRDTVTKDLLITDGVVTVNIDEYTITDDTVTITNADLESESFELHQSLNSEDQLIFGSCESSYVSFIYHPSETISTLAGKTLKVYIIPDHHPSRILQLGVFKVRKDKLTNNRKARRVVAYDAMYDILNTDMADWYNEIAFRQLIPGLEPVVSMSAFRNFFLQYFQIEIEETTLVNDSINLRKTINPDQLSGADIIKAICEINGVFGQITNEGKFRFVELVRDIREESEEVTDLEVQHYIDVEYADFDSKAITGVRIITNEDIQGLGSREEPKNFYVINGNFLISNYRGSDLVGVARRLLPKIINRYYQPLTVNAIGNPVHEVGDAIKVILTDGTELPTYILERTLKGIQGLRDTYTAQGEETAAESLNSTSSRYTQISNEIAQATSQAVVAASSDFVETIRNIGFRLLDEPSDVVVEYDEENQQVELSWTDPDDIDTLEPVPCEWAGTVVVRSEDHAPLHRWDGTLIEDSTTRDEYSETPLVDDTIEVGKTYYYGIFPYHVWLDDANNPIKHYRYTKVVKVGIKDTYPPQSWRRTKVLLDSAQGIIDDIFTGMYTESTPSHGSDWHFDANNELTCAAFAANILHLTHRFVKNNATKVYLEVQFTHVTTYGNYHRFETSVTGEVIYLVNDMTQSNIEGTQPWYDLAKTTIELSLIGISPDSELGERLFTSIDGVPKITKIYFDDDIAIVPTT